MPKLFPQERWKRHIIEQLKALKLSGELKQLRAKGLATLGRRKLYTTGEEWWQDFGKRASSPEYLKWSDECKTLADRYGLAPWVVVFLYLMKGYKPEKDIDVIVMEAQRPRIRVVTECTDSLFLQRLAYEAQKLGLYVVQRQGSFETTLLNLDYFEPEAASLPPSSRPPADVAFYIRVETPPGYPPEAASQLQKEASKLGRELRRRLGYPTRERLRTSSLVSMAEDLKVSRGHLPSGGTYDIIGELYDDDDGGSDQQRRKLIKSRRHRVRERLVEPYKQDTGSAG